MRYLGGDINRVGAGWTIGDGLNVGHVETENVQG